MMSDLVGLDDYVRNIERAYMDIMDEIIRTCETIPNLTNVTLQESFDFSVPLQTT